MAVMGLLLLLLLLLLLFLFLLLLWLHFLLIGPIVCSTRPWRLWTSSKPRFPRQAAGGVGGDDAGVVDVAIVAAVGGAGVADVAVVIVISTVPFSFFFVPPGPRGCERVPCGGVRYERDHQE